MSTKHWVYVLRCTLLPLDNIIVGVYATRAGAVKAWEAYCAGGYKRTFGARNGFDSTRFEIKRYRLNE